MFDPREKVALFIDGINLYYAAKSIGFEVDFGKLLAVFRRRGYLLRAYYYTVLMEDAEFSALRPLVDWLSYNGYEVTTKPGKEYIDSTGRRKSKGNLEIEMAIDALEQAATVDHLVLFSGESDFVPLIEALQRKGRKVSVVSTVATHPSMVGDDLRRRADYFIDLVSLRSEIERAPISCKPRNEFDSEINSRTA